MEFICGLKTEKLFTDVEVTAFRQDLEAATEEAFAELKIAKMESWQLSKTIIFC